MQAGFGGGKVPGGWPNGRRFGDDVLDIAVTALISDLRVSPPIIRRSGRGQRRQQRYRLQQGVPVRGDAAERSHAHSLVSVMSCPTRTRHRPGPLALVVLGWLVISGGELLAHDPGLSSLDVSVTRSAISLSLSLAASDVALIAPSGDPRPQLRALARDAVRVSIDGETLSPLADEVLIKDGAAYLHLSFAIEGRPEGRHYDARSNEASPEPTSTPAHCL